MRKLLVLHVAALGYDLLQACEIKHLASLPIQRLTTVFPAVTCTAQATLRTALPPEAHRMMANGFYDPTTRQAHFWNQSSALVKGPRIWETFRAQGGRVGMYFFQQSLGESVDEIVSPAPIHAHGGKLIMATYSQPPELLNGKNPVKLWQYWGPLASKKVGRGIVKLLTERLEAGNAPELLLAYLPSLDYDLQRLGVSYGLKTCGMRHPNITSAVKETVEQIEQVAKVAQQKGYELLICGDYAITDVNGSVAYPNRILRAAGLFQTRIVKGMLYPDFHRSTAFALCDHQVAILYAQEDVRQKARELLESLPEVDAFATQTHGDTLIFTAKPGSWFAYPWWEKPSEAPDYATHVDIHNKPGFDPCELHFGKTPFQCSTDTKKIYGTHGRNEAPVAYAASLNFSADTLLQLAEQLQKWLSHDNATLRI